MFNGAVRVRVAMLAFSLLLGTACGAGVVAPPSPAASSSTVAASTLTLLPTAEATTSSPAESPTLVRTEAPAVSASSSSTISPTLGVITGPTRVESNPSETAPSMDTPGPAGSLSAQRTVTLDDHGTTLDLKVGEGFLLALGEGFDWSVTVSDPSVVDRGPNVLAVRGAQGLYRAMKQGSTTLTAVGDPPCRKAQPACGAPSRLFRMEIVVR